MESACPKQYAIPHGAKVFAAAFLLAKYLQKSKPPSNCPLDEIKILNKDKHLMEPAWRIAPYDYKLTRDAPISSVELLMMLSKKEYEVVNPPQAPEPNLASVKLHYDYQQAYKRIRL